MLTAVLPLAGTAQPKHDQGALQVCLAVAIPTPLLGSRLERAQMQIRYLQKDRGALIAGAAGHTCKHKGSAEHFSASRRPAQGETQFQA